MTRLLVSVRDAAEAQLALAAGVDLIDLKEPNRGPLGPVDSRTIAEVVELIDGRTPVSVALGELVDATAAIVASLPAKLSYAKLGLAGCAKLPDWPGRLAAIFEALPRSIAPVVVIYADHQLAAAPTPEEVLAAASRLGCRAVLIDTFDKSSGDLFAHLSREELGRAATNVLRMGLKLVLAGSLTLDTIPLALEFEPNYVALRGAVCSGSRNTAIDADRLRQIVETLARGRNSRPAATINAG